MNEGTVASAPCPGCSGEEDGGCCPRNQEKSLKPSRGPGWTAGERGVGAVSGSRRAHTPRPPNPDTSTGPDHVRGHTTTRPPTSIAKCGPTERGHWRETDSPNHGHTKAQADTRPRNKIHKDSQTRDARVRTKTLEAPVHAHGPLAEPLSPESPLRGSGSPLRPSPGRQAAAADALGPGKVEGPPAPPLRPAPLARRMEQRG